MPDHLDDLVTLYIMLQDAVSAATDPEEVAECMLDFAIAQLHERGRTRDYFRARFDLTLDSLGVMEGARASLKRES
jgi:hypothetical protein